MSLLATALQLALATAIVAPAAVSAEPVAASGGFAEVFVSASGLPTPAIADGIALRLPDLLLHTRWDLGALQASEPSQVFIAVRSADDGGVRIEVITGDGRGFVRAVPAGGDSAREATTAIASLLLSIERQEVAADREGVAPPTSNAAPDLEAASSRLNATTPIEAQPDEPPPTVAEAPPPTPVAEAEPEPLPAAAETRPEPDGWQVGASAGAGALFGLGPPRFGSILQGAGLELSAMARAPKGVLFGLGFRVLARARDDRRLTRLRIAAAAGYSLRVGRFALPLTVELGAEPWLVADADGRIPLDDLAAPASGAVLLSSSLRARPGWLIRPKPNAVAAVRVGVDLGAGGGFVIDDGAKVATLRDDEDPDSGALFRLGGLELFVGAGATIWFATGR